MVEHAGKGDKEEKKSVIATLETEITFTYCTEFIVSKDKSLDKNALGLRAYLETIGDSCVVVDDDDIIKIHVHTDNPGKALQKALEFGQFINNPKPKIENMRIQHEGKVREAKKLSGFEYKEVDPDRKYGFVAGVIAGMMHAFLVTSVPLLHGGFCLYNGGFTAGIVAFLIAPVLETYAKVKNEN